MDSSSRAAPTPDEIRLRAYQIFLQRAGRPGNPEADWLQAERELTGRAGPQSPAGESLSRHATLQFESPISGAAAKASTRTRAATTRQPEIVVNPAQPTAETKGSGRTSRGRAKPR